MFLITDIKSGSSLHLKVYHWRFALVRKVIGVTLLPQFNTKYIYRLLQKITNEESHANNAPFPFGIHQGDQHYLSSDNYFLLKRKEQLLTPKITTWNQHNRPHKHGNLLKNSERRKLPNHANSSTRPWPSCFPLIPGSDTRHLCPACNCSQAHQVIGYKFMFVANVCIMI